MDQSFEKETSDVMEVEETYERNDIEVEGQEEEYRQGFGGGFGGGLGGGFGYFPPFAIHQCLFRYTYIFPYRGRPFLTFINFVGPYFISGFRLDPRFGWVPFEMNIRRIAHFSCHHWY